MCRGLSSQNAAVTMFDKDQYCRDKKKLTLQLQIGGLLVDLVRGHAFEHVVGRADGAFEGV